MTPTPRTDAPEDEIPLPSLPALSEEETSRQIREDMNKYNPRIRQLETELIALQKENNLLNQVSGELCRKCNWRMKFPSEPCRCELEKERDQLLATVEGLREALQNSDALNRNLVEAAELETLQYFSEYKRTLKGTEQALQYSLPPTNLVKRSVLERLVWHLGKDHNPLSYAYIEALKEAHEELQRTK